MILRDYTIKVSRSDLEFLVDILSSIQDGAADHLAADSLKTYLEECIVEFKIQRDAWFNERELNNELRKTIAPDIQSSENSEADGNDVD